MHKSQSCLKGKVMDLEVHKRNIFDNFFLHILLHVYVQIMKTLEQQMAHNICNIRSSHWSGLESVLKDIKYKYVLNCWNLRHDVISIISSQRTDVFPSLNHQSKCDHVKRTKVHP